MQQGSRSFAPGSSLSGDAAEHGEDRSRSDIDLGDLVIVLLAGTLAGLRDRLTTDGFQQAADLVAELAERCDSYIEEVAR